MDNVNGFPAGQLFLGRDGKVSGPFTREQIEAMRASGELAQYHWLWDGSGQWVAASLPPPPPPVMPRAGSATVSAVTVPMATAPTPFETADDEKTEEVVVKKSTTAATPPSAPTETKTMDLSASAAPVAAEPPKKAQRPPLFAKTAPPAPVEKTSPPVAKAAPPAPTPPVRATQSEAPAKNQRPGPAVSAQGLAAVRAVCFDRNLVMNGTLARATSEGCTFALRLGVHPQKTMFLPGRPIWLNLVDDVSGRSENVRATLTSGTRVDGKLELRLKWERLPKLLGAQMQTSAG